MFSNKDLKNMILPSFFELLLIMLVGVVDTFNVSYCGEAAVSGVSLVNQFNSIFILLFSALGSGGAVIISQYIGSKNEKLTVRSSSQLLMFSTIFSIALSIIVFIFHTEILSFLFGKVEKDVMTASISYMQITIYSYTFLAIYNAGAALQKSMGKTKITMYISGISNILNIIGNCIGVYILKAGVAGVAWPSFIARAFSAVIITYLCFKKGIARYTASDIFAIDFSVLKRILRVAIPNSLENAVFQIVKVSLSALIALFGTYQIAAYGVAQSFWSLGSLMSGAMDPIFVTVIGQCIGANDKVSARYYFKKLLGIAIKLSVAWNFFIIILTPIFLTFYNLTPETKSLAFKLVLIHSLFNGLGFTLSAPLGAGLRAAGDIKYTMIVSIISTIAIRLVFSFIFGLTLNMGAIGITIAMVMDWFFKGGLNLLRARSNKWEQFKMI